MQVEISIKNITCPVCSSKKIAKSGIIKRKLQTSQRYHCKICKKFFKLESKLQTSKTYSIETILKAITLYNLGNSQTKIQGLLKTTPKPSQKTISNWVKEFSPFLPYKKLKTKISKESKHEDIIQQHTFLHNNLPYKFQFHTKKLSSTFIDNKFTKHKKFKPVEEYIKKIITKDFPHHIFKPNPNLENKSDRSSQSKFPYLKIEPLKKQNLANKLAELALNLARTNKQRHEAIQDFMITNDSTTIATEVPIYLTHDDLLYFTSRHFNLNPNNFNTPITGHIDILQIRNNNIHILDYKPEAKKENPIQQLTIYALALASRTKLPISNFKCAWFDEKNYFEFFPLHCVYPKSNP